MFFSFGFLYGSVNYTVFSLYTRIPRANPLLMTFLDTFVHLPGSFLPCFYCTQQAIMRVDERSKPNFFQDCVVDGLSLYRQNFVDDFKGLCAVWIPVNLACFSVVPLHLRTPFISLFGFAYPCLLSFTRGGTGAVVSGPAS